VEGQSESGTVVWVWRYGSYYCNKNVEARLKRNSIGKSCLENGTMKKHPGGVNKSMENVFAPY